MIKNRSYTKEILIVVTLASVGATTYFAGENSKLYSEIEDQAQKIEVLQADVSTYDKRLGLEQIKHEELRKRNKKIEESFSELKDIAKRQQDLLNELNNEYEKATKDAEEWKAKYYKSEADLKKL